MGTPNSKQEEVRPVDFILGRQTKQKELTQNDWVRVISELMEHIAPRLKYVHGMIEFRRHMNEPLGGGSSTIFFHTNQSLLNLCEEKLPQKTQCVHLCSLRCKSPSWRLIPKIEHSPNDHDHSILLTRDGQLYLYFVHWQLQKVKGRDKYYSAEKLVVRPIQPNELELTYVSEGVMTESEGQYGRQTIHEMCEGGVICDGLYALLQRTIREKERRLQELKEIISAISKIHEHVVNLPHEEA